MADPFVGEIRLFSFAFAPRGWALCDGQTLQIQQNQALFALLGVQYGGNGTATFQLPDLRGRAPLFFGTSPVSGTTYAPAATGGVETVALTEATLPPHTHAYAVSAAPAGRIGPNDTRSYAATPPANLYGQAAPTVPLNAAAIDPAGGGQTHANMQPFLALNFCIALTGVYPSRN